jgi:hypothetical protein
VKQRASVVAVLLLATSLVDGGCTSQRKAPAEKASKKLIVDDAHGGSSGLYFLPPMVPQPVLLGAFAADLAPVVQIDELSSPGGTVLGTLATYTMTTGPGSETVRLADSLYVVNWHTNEFSLDTQHVYRIQVLLSGRVLGFADVQPVVSGGQMKNVDTDQYVPLVDGRTLPIKFWMNRCAPVVCVASSLRHPS